MNTGDDFNLRVKNARLRNIISRYLMPWTILFTFAFIMAFLITYSHQFTGSRVVVFIVSTIILFVFLAFMNGQRKRSQMQYWEMTPQRLSSYGDDIFDIFVNEIRREISKIEENLNSVQKELENIVGPGFPMGGFFEKCHYREEYENFKRENLEKINPDFMNIYEIEYKLITLDLDDDDRGDYLDMLGFNYDIFLDDDNPVYDHYNLIKNLDNLYHQWHERGNIISYSPEKRLLINETALNKSAAVFAAWVLQSKHLKLHKVFGLESMYGYVFERSLWGLSASATKRLCRLLDEEMDFGLFAGGHRPVFVFSQESPF